MVNIFLALRAVGCVPQLLSSARTAESSPGLDPEEWTWLGANKIVFMESEVDVLVGFLLKEYPSAPANNH